MIIRSIELKNIILNFPFKFYQWGTMKHSVKNFLSSCASVIALILFTTASDPISAKEYDNKNSTIIHLADVGDEYDDDQDGDYYDDGMGDSLTPNGAGDQFLKIGLMPNFPLNFGNKMYVGGAISIGYHRFLTSWLALGADAMFGYNPTIGSNMFTYVPLTLGVTFQPWIWRFEFPITLNIGMAIENYLSYTYFPGLIIRPETGVFYRINEKWSVGIEAQFTYMPQWYANDHSKDDYLNLMSATACVRYHF